MRWIRPSNNTCMKNYGTDPLLHFMCLVQYLYLVLLVYKCSLHWLRSCQKLCFLWNQSNKLHRLKQTQPRPQILLVLYNCGQLVYPARRRVAECCRAEEVVAKWLLNLTWSTIFAIFTFQYIFFTFLKRFIGNTSGLMGFWDGKKDREFLLPDGVFLNINPSESRRLHYEFGQQCKHFNPQR